MIRKLLSRVFKKSSSNTGSLEPRIIPRKVHGVGREQISPCAANVTTRLQEAGFVAFVVGGAVRDLLLGIQPKDYDVATNATPEQVYKLFRRAFIIGRRFRLVHVMCGHETVEVSTFRGTTISDGVGEKLSDEHGRIVRDNVFGSQAEDAERRDFTVNSMFYDPTTEEILDFRNGMEDVRAKLLRIIGDPEQRYREDPVRMIRAVRLSAKLGMEIEQSTRAPIATMAPLLQNVPPSRLFDEMLKLLLSGHAWESVLTLRKHGLHHGLLPLLDVILEQPLGERFVMMALQNTDARIGEGKSVSPGFLFATLLWHEVLAAWSTAQEAGEKPVPALFQAMDQVIDIQAQKIAISKRYGSVMKEIWSLQPRFLGRAGRRPYRLLEHPRFRAGFDFLLLRCESGEVEAELGEWWEKFQHATADEREEMLLKDDVPKKRRRRRKPNASAKDTEGTGSEASLIEDTSQ